MRCDYLLWKHRKHPMFRYAVDITQSLNVDNQQDCTSMFIDRTKIWVDMFVTFAWRAHCSPLVSHIPHIFVHRRLYPERSYKEPNCKWDLSIQLTSYINRYIHTYDLLSLPSHCDVFCVLFCFWGGGGMSKFNANIARKWTFFSSKKNTIRMHSSRAFIWMVTRLDFLRKKMNSSVTVQTTIRMYSSRAFIKWSHLWV